MPTLPPWLPFALGSAFFAALTAILGKIGVASINSDVATFIRTVVILLLIATILGFRKEWPALATIDHRGTLFLVLSGLATGLSWLCYYRALQLGPVTSVAPVDKLGVAIAIVLAIVFLGEMPSLKVLAGGFLVVLGALLLALP